MKYIISMGPGIGDFIMILPMAARIKSNDKDARIDVLIRSDKNRIKVVKQLQRVQNLVNSVFYYSKEEPLQSICTLMHLFKIKYDYAIEFNYKDSPDLSRWPIKIFKIIANKTIGADLNNRINYDICVSQDKTKSLSYRNTDMLDAIGYYMSESEYITCKLDENLIEKNTRDEIKEVVGTNIITLITGTAKLEGVKDNKKIQVPAKSWNDNNWRQLSLELHNRGYKVVFLDGSKNDSFNNGYSINLCGKTTILESLFVISKSKMVIGCDTGLMHCAGNLDIPSITLFGPTSQIEYKPEGSKSFVLCGTCENRPCFGNKNLIDCSDYVCMSSIKVEDVLNIALQII